MKKMMAVLMTTALALSMSVPAFAATAKPSADKVSVNGLVVSPQVYNIDGYNYFKLRDVAKALSGTAAGFDVKWDAAAKKILLETGADYSGSMAADAALSKEAREAKPGDGDILVDGKAVSLTAYAIDGYNYFKLRDLGEAVGFEVTWDAAAKVVGINAETKDAAEEETDLYDLFTIGFGCSALSEDGLYYYFAANETVDFCCMLMISEDLTESMNVTGETVENEDGSLTIYDATGEYEMTFWVEDAGEGNILVTFTDGVQVVLTALDAELVVDVIVAADENTEIIVP